MPIHVSPDPLVAGESATISYGPNPSRANTTVTVQISDGGDHSENHQVPLDGNGAGSFQWTVPHWQEAHFNAPDCDEVVVAIEEPSAPPGG